MTNAPCPECGARVRIETVLENEGCPDCETPLGELHAIAADGGVK